MNVKSAAKILKWTMAGLAAIAVGSMPAQAKPKAHSKSKIQQQTQEPAKKTPEAVGEAVGEPDDEPAPGLEDVARKWDGMKLGFWVSDIAKISTYAYVNRDDQMNRIMCLLTITMKRNRLYQGGGKEQIQLVHLQRDGNNVEVTEAEEIDAQRGGIYVLFTPQTLYVLDFDANSFMRYTKR